MQRLNDFYYSWGAAVGRLHRDGVIDVAAGPYFYIGPDYTKFREIYPAQTVNPSAPYPNDCMQNFAGDFTGDGWRDAICMGAIGQASTSTSTRKRAPPRDKFDVVPAVQKEVSLLKDVDGDGKPEFVYGGGGFLRLRTRSVESHGRLDRARHFDRRTLGRGHGLGVGDVNGDGKRGRRRYLRLVGTARGRRVQRPVDVSSGGVRQMDGARVARWGRDRRYDVNGDRLTDVVTVLQAHGFGLAWFEQKRDASGSDPSCST